MAVLPVLQFPDPKLHTKAETVEHIDDEIRQIVADMFDTMYAHQGLGLAGTQVNIHKRIFVMDITGQKENQVCMINPEIISKSGTQIDHHGCLSVGAGVSDQIKRAATLRVRGLDIDGNTIEFDAEGTTAICVQHEIDHLNGMLFINHLSRLKQSRIRAKIEKYKRLSSKG